PKPKLLINIPGASVRGPIKKNKLFYFFNWEQRNDRSATNESRVVPSLDLRQGILHYHNRQNVLSTVTPQQLRTMDPRGIGASAAVLQVFNKYPLPNDFSTLGDGINFQGFRFAAPGMKLYDTYTTRFDYQLNPNHNFFLRGQLQNDHWSLLAQQFPGQADS